MYTIDKYLNDIELLTSSLVIKHHDIGVIMNKWLFLNTGETSSQDYTQWKYYLNLSGVKHHTNNDVKIVVIETGLTVSLTKDILAQYRVTQQDLDKRLDSYKALLENYPDDILYITGCINPVDINKAISAPNGTILSYTTQYIEPQEYSMIRELSIMLSLFFERWYIKEYNITDDLYMASVLSVMYTNIPNMIATIRLNGAYTSEAHSFHIEHFFRSHLDIWDNVKGLNQTTIMWLYRNLETLMNNVGVNQTLDTVIAKLFTSNGVGLANYTLVPGAYTTTSSSDANTQTFKIDPPKITTKAMNVYYKNPTPPQTISELTARIINSNKYTVFNSDTNLDILTQATISKVGVNTKLTQPTKIIDFGKVLLFKTYSNSLLETVLDNWLIMANTGQYVQHISFNDPNTKDTYDLDLMSGLLLFYQLLFKKLGVVDPDIMDIRYANIIDSNITKATLLDKLLAADGNSYIADIILRDIPVPPSSITTVLDFQNLINNYIQLYSTVWTLDSNINNTFLSANIKEMVHKITNVGSIQVTPTSVPIKLSTLLSNKGIVINIIPGYDIDLTLVQLFKSFTGYELHEDVLITNLYNNLERLLEKLTSYTIQTIASDIVTDSIRSPYSSIAVNQTPYGYVQVTTASTIKNLEDISGVVNGEGNDFVSELNVSNTQPLNLIDIDATGHIQLSGHANFMSTFSVNPTKPNVHAEILRASYIKYGPTTTAEANSANGISQYTATNTGVPPTVNTTPTMNDIYVTAHNTKVVATPTATVEVVGSNYVKP